LSLGFPWPRPLACIDEVRPIANHRVAEIVKIIASKYGVEVEVVDVARENALHRILRKKRDKIEAFPTLVADTGQRFEGEMTEEKIEPFICQISNEGRKKYL
jgi:hypothetical protein